MKILVVDDEQDMQLLFAQKFRKELKAGEIEFQFAFSGEKALEKIREQGVADRVLILSDINMPGMSGFELLKQIKDQFPQIKVCLITAYGDDASYEKAKSNGADGYITKPIDFDDLKKRLFTF